MKADGVEVTATIYDNFITTIFYKIIGDIQAKKRKIGEEY